MGKMKDDNVEAYVSTGRVAIIYDTSVSSYCFAAKEIVGSMHNAGYSVRELPICGFLNVTTSVKIIITTIDSPEAQDFLRTVGEASLPSLTPQGYLIRKQIKEDDTFIWIIGFDETGAMYGGLDAAESIKHSGSLGRLEDVLKNPYLTNRGIKFNIPLDARTPSYSDAGDSAQKNIANMWEMGFWQEFLDEMARDRYNVLSLWSEHPFPSMVKVAEYPNVALADVKKTTIRLTSDLAGQNMSTSISLANLVTVKVMTIEEKVEFWRGVMQYAADRGIDIYIFTWNVFVFGTEDSGYGFTTNLSDTNTIDYFRKSVKAMIETYPLLKGIGISAGENMNGEKSEKEDWLWKTYGLGINDALTNQPGRDFRLIHRTIVTDPGDVGNIFDGLNAQCKLDFSYKYSIAHMYSSDRPVFIHRDGFLESLPADKKTWLTLRDDDFYMFRWGDPEFARSYIRNIPMATNQILGFYMGPDGYTWGREYISTEPDAPNQLIINKKWFSFMLWGRLGYDPDLPADLFRQMLELRFPEVSSDQLYEAWSKASQIIPMVTRFHWSRNIFDFHWNPETCLRNHIGKDPIDGEKIALHTVLDFIEHTPQGGSGMMSILEYAAKLLAGEAMTGITPVQVAQDLQNLADPALQLTLAMSDAKDKELRQTIGDIDAMSWLGRYYSLKILGAVNKCLYDQSLRLDYKKCAIDYLQDASCHWRIYASKVSCLYVPQILTRFVTRNAAEPVDVIKLQIEVDNDISLV